MDLMTDAFQQIVQQLHRQVFNAVVSNRLVYNTCWEDPRVDRELLDIGPDSRIVTLTSAGCNALDYLLDDPQHIDCVDANPAQNALLELKLALYRSNDPDMLWDFFGEGGTAGASQLYRRELREKLPGPAASWWDRNIDYFEPGPEADSFYYRGTTGRVARLFRRRIRRKGLEQNVRRMLRAETLPEQAWHYEEIEPQLWNAFYRWLMRRNGTLALLGVPRPQRRLIEREGGLLPFIRNSMRRVFTERPLDDNYFWRVYLTGSYRRDCAPNYLRPGHFHTLRARSGRIATHTRSLNAFLEQSTRRYSHFVLLDHMDWMAHSRPGELEREWRLILERARPGARILFRSAGTDASFLPAWVRERVDLQGYCDTAAGQNGASAGPHDRDRVGTYGSTHLGVVRP